jgi:MoaA/NifB/PqqE/SkfB family radical SAM enzyme
MKILRREKWGAIVYNRVSDEFDAYINSSTTLATVGRPLSAGILITGRCNLSCSFCYGNDESLPKEEIAAPEWRKIFARLQSWGLMRVDISGGEPTMKRDFPDIVTAANDLGLATIVSTNGLVLRPEQLSKFCNVRWHVSMDSGLEEIHEASRKLPVLKPSLGSLNKTTEFLQRCLELGFPCRVLTCVGNHNAEALYALGERLALLGIREWNISRVLRAGRAQVEYERRWIISDQSLREQVQDLRCAFEPLMRIRYSDRTDQNGYFLLALPDGSLATQFTDGRDKVKLGNPLEMNLTDLQNNQHFDLLAHGRKWIATTFESGGGDIEQFSFPIAATVESHRLAVPAA